MEMPPSNIRQASIIPSAQVIPNPLGTAPGWWIEKDNRIIITMPGPPREMELMWTKETLPKLQKLTAGTVIVSKTLKIFGPSEAKVDEMVNALLSSTNPTIGTYAKIDGVHLRITAKSNTTDKAQKLISQRESEIRAILGDYIWGIDTDSLEKIVGDLLIEKRLTIATMESCTGGLLANVITNIPRSYSYFKGGLVGYAGKTKTAFGLDEKFLSQFNAISSEVAKAMATTIRNKLGASIGIGITGVTGPKEIGSMPVGTIFIGIDDGQQQYSSTKNYPGNRLQIKQRAVTSTLFELRKILL
jgi:nicotinamide-nucleotide amidase